MFNLRICLVISLAFLLNACKNTISTAGGDKDIERIQSLAQTSKEQKQMNKQPVSNDSERSGSHEWHSMGCKEVSRLSMFIDLGVAEIKERLGLPERKESFQMGKYQDEFHIALQNTYPLTIPENMHVNIQEWNWKKGECCLTLWLHKVDDEWRSFETLLWHKDTDF